MEKISKHKVKDPCEMSPSEMVRFRTFNIIRNASIKEIGRLMHDYDISLADLKKNGYE